MKIEKNQVLVQIGVFDGLDEFNNIVKHTCPTKLILVEPNKIMNSQILENYKDVENVFIENFAITEETKGFVDLVHPKRISRKKRQFYNKCFSLLPMDDWGDSFKKVVVPSLSFMDLCKKHDLTHIHFLQIDTEGYDSIIIKSIDFSKITIDILRYENWSFPEECFTRHGEAKKHLGINGMYEVKVLLEGLGYTLEEEGEDITAIKN